ncbi:MAG: hypothetical protein OEY64_12140 [Nitrospinota bacterium]|nr:hypothetical protein [Nitrospinota bacterium]
MNMSVVFGYFQQLVGMNDVFRVLFMIEFAIIALLSLTSLLKAITLDHDIRQHFIGRLSVFDTFFKVYQAEKERIAEEAEEERKKQETLKNIRDVKPAEYEAAPVAEEEDELDIF